jgi:hypothetical protein
MGNRVVLAACAVVCVLTTACKSKRAAPPVAAAHHDAGVDAFVIPEDKDEYVPAEFKSGADRWRDTGIYVDGTFVGLLAWAELPVALKPVWIKVKASAPKRFGTSDTGWVWERERRYRFRDLVVTLGLDPAQVKEVHVYGPRFTETTIVSGRELMSKAADEWFFRFGGMIKGKAIESVPEGLGNGVTPDKVSSVMIYVAKKPPVLDRRVGLMLDGEVQEGVPYFGTPLRGGVRVYKDDRLVAYIKRQDLPQDQATTTAGEPRWQLYPYLTHRGIDVADVVEGWVVRDEAWAEKLDRAQLEDLWFAAGAQAKGHIELGDAKIKAQALILRSHPVAKAEVPTPEPEEL